MKVLPILYVLLGLVLIMSLVEFLWRTSLLLLGTLLILFMVTGCSFMLNRYRMQKAGYKVTRIAGPEDFEVHYQEGSLSLKFYGVRDEHADVLLVPNESQWVKSMPEEFKQRRAEIIDRIYLQINPRRFPIFTIKAE